MTTSPRRPPSEPCAGDDSALDSLVILVAESHGYTCHPRPGDAVLLSGAHRLHIAMRNLRQLARKVSRDDWPALVADHISTIINAVEEPLDLSDFDRIGHLLRSRIYPAEANAELLVMRPFAPGLIEALVIDTPTTVRTVVRADLASWSVAEEELFARGRRGVRCDGPLEDFELGIADIHILTGGTFYAATHLAWLDVYLNIGAYGAIVAAPHRGAIAAHPVHGRRAYDAVRHLREFAWRRYEEGPGSLTPDLFWWRRGMLTAMEPVADGGLPDELRALIEAAPPQA